MKHARHRRYWQRFLLPDEKITRTFGVSGWYIFVFWVVPSIVLLAIAIYLSVVELMLGLLIGLVFLSTVVPAIFLRYFVHYAITDKRVMTREGILRKNFVTADLPSVTDVTVQESFLERLLTHTGIVGVNTAGSDLVEVHFRHVQDPFAIRQDIYRHQYKEVEERKLDVLQKNGSGRHV